jgi:hypothetical protein
MQLRHQGEKEYMQQQFAAQFERAKVSVTQSEEPSV